MCTLQDETVAVCTIEKANGAVNRLVQEGRMHELCCIIVDEVGGLLGRQGLGCKGVAYDVGHGVCTVRALHQPA